MASGIWLAQRYNAQVMVYWNCIPECYCRFTDIFQPIQIKDFQLINTTGILHTIFSFKYSLKFPKIFQHLGFKNIICDGGGVDHIDMHANMMLLICGHSVAPHYPMTELFRPAQVVKDVIDSVTAGFDSNTMGLHFRGTDNFRCKAFTTLEKFIACIDAKLETKPSTTFFLATDEIDIRRALVERYGKRIMYHENVLSRGSVEGMVGGAIDLYCLAATRGIIGSYWSSFSEIAAELGSIDLDVVK